MACGVSRRAKEKYGLSVKPSRGQFVIAYSHREPNI